MLEKSHLSQNLELLNTSRRLEVAKQILTVIKLHLKRDQNLKKLKVIDLGCSVGVITNYLAKNFQEIKGIDIDQDAIKYAKKHFPKSKNITFEIMDSTNLLYPNESFDIVICNQVYCCIKNQQRLFTQIHRVLKNGGICFLTGANKYSLFKKKADYKLYYLSLSKLKKMCSKFQVYPYTTTILQNPKKYNFKNLTPYQNILKHVPKPILNIAEPLFPNIIWILKK